VHDRASGAALQSSPGQAGAVTKPSRQGSRAGSPTTHAKAMPKSIRETPMSAPTWHSMVAARMSGHPRGLVALDGGGTAEARLRQGQTHDRTHGAQPGQGLSRIGGHPQISAMQSSGSNLRPCSAARQWPPCPPSTRYDVLRVSHSRQENGTCRDDALMHHVYACLYHPWRFAVRRSGG
jgi:hypothetical protein